MNLIKKNWPAVKAAVQYSKLYLTRRRAPLYAGLLLTPRCNLNCVYCFPDSPHRGHENELSRQKIFDLIDELYDMGTRYIALLGGEPLLREDFDDIVEYLVQKKIIIEVITNGYFTRQKIDALKKVHFVCHSLDGNQADMEKNRGPGSYKKIMESLDLCRDNNIAVQMRTVFNKNNINSLDYLANLARRRKTTLGVCEQAVIKARDKEYALTTVELKQFWMSVRQYKQGGYPLDKTLSQIERMINLPTEIPMDRIFRKSDVIPSNLSYKQCHISNGHVFIDSNGLMYPCAMLLGKKEGGQNIYDSGGLAGAWEALGNNNCRFCRQSLQDLKSEFFSYDGAAIKAVTTTLLSKINM